jgi:hypothetical protein
VQDDSVRDDAVRALRRIAFELERGGAPTYRVRAFRRAAQVLAGLAAGELGRRVEAGTLEALPGIGTTTAQVITEAAGGQQPGYLAGCSPTSRPRRGTACARRCAATATRTRTGPTAAARRGRWPRPPATSATSGSR